MNARFLSKFLPYGTLHREQVKNELLMVQRLCRRGVLKKTFHRGKVFYELTPQAVPLLEHSRKILLEQAQLEAALSRSSFFRALLGDLRFLNEKDPLAKHFMFLGDWQLTKPVVPSQLELSKLRFYQSKGLA